MLAGAIGRRYDGFMPELALRSRPSLLVPLLSVAVSAWFALWACAPAASLPVPGVMTDAHTSALGAAASYSVVPPSSNDVLGLGSGVNGQFWYAHRFGHLNLGGGLAAGQSSAVSGGAFFGGLYPVGPAQMGFQVAGGFLWAEVGMPIVLPAGEHAWLYTEPSVGLRRFAVHLPIGVGFRLGKGFVLAPEVNLQYGASLMTGTRPAAFLDDAALTASLHAAYAF